MIVDKFPYSLAGETQWDDDDDVAPPPVPAKTEGAFDDHPHSYSPVECKNYYMVISF